MTDYAKIKYYWEYYAQGTSDQRGVENFVVCETYEAVTGFRDVLIGIANGNYNADTLDQILRPKRIPKHENYEEWAKAMLRWMAEARKHA